MFAHTFDAFLQCERILMGTVAFVGLLTQIPFLFNYLQRCFLDEQFWIHHDW